jgi:hypothetical protein
MDDDPNGAFGDADRDLTILAAPVTPDEFLLVSPFWNPRAGGGGVAFRDGALTYRYGAAGSVISRGRAAERAGLPAALVALKTTV